MSYNMVEKRIPTQIAQQEKTPDVQEKTELEGATKYQNNSLKNIVKKNITLEEDINALKNEMKSKTTRLKY